MKVSRAPKRAPDTADAPTLHPKCNCGCCGGRWGSPCSFPQRICRQATRCSCPRALGKLAESSENDISTRPRGWHHACAFDHPLAPLRNCDLFVPRRDGGRNPVVARAGGIRSRGAVVANPLVAARGLFNAVGGLSGRPLWRRALPRGRVLAREGAVGIGMPSPGRRDSGRRGLRLAAADDTSDDEHGDQSGRRGHQSGDGHGCLPMIPRRPVPSAA